MVHHVDEGAFQSFLLAVSMTLLTVADHLYWSYANLAMSHAAVNEGAVRFHVGHFQIRSRLFKGLGSGTMSLGELVDDEKLKMVLPQACCYCGSTERLAADHLIPTSRGGPNRGENLVWACRTCNSSKGARDMLEWLGTRGVFPPLLLLRRYLKLVIDIATAGGLMDAVPDDAGALPFTIRAVPLKFPSPGELRLWTTPVHPYTERT